ncbi:MAG TPA: chloride channel protein [Candidatus Nanopelagicales bacterium]
MKVPSRTTRSASLWLRRTLGRSLTGLRSAPYVRKWVVLGVAIGIVAGLGAVAFISALRFCTWLLLGQIGGYLPATTSGEGGISPASDFARPWAIPLVVAVGGLVSGLLVFGLAPEAEGHGTDAAIAAVHHNPRGMRARVTVVKMVASAITIGSGGSGGREGPTAQISATFGSMISRLLNLSPEDSRIAVSAGIGSGIGAIFRAPVGGALLGAELPYRNDIEVEALVPSLVASVVAFAVFGSVEGFDPIFGYHDQYHFSDVRDLAYFAVLGVVAGLMGRLYALTFHRLSATMRASALPRVLKPALAGLAVGCIGLLIPGVLGTGYGQVQQALDRTALLGMPLWLVLMIPFAKILATTLSIGSGGSGGIFGPGMVIGGVTGAAVWRLLELFTPGLPTSPVPFVIVGMMACFGSIAHAPLSVMLMVAEMTGNLSLLAPAIVAVVLAVVVVGDTTIYTSQLGNRSESPAHRFGFGLPTAASVPIRSAMARPRVVLSADTAVALATEELSRAGVPGAPVVSSGAFIGVVGAGALAGVGDPDTPVGGLADRTAMTVAADATLDVAIEALATNPDGWVTVLDPDLSVVGVVAVPDLVRGYRSGLLHATRRLARVRPGTVLMESEVRPGAPADGGLVRDLGLPASTIVLTVLREGALLFSEGSTRLRQGDAVSILTTPGADADLAQIFGGHVDLAGSGGEATGPDSLI